MSKGPVVDGLSLQRVAEPSERKRVDKRADFIVWLKTDDHLLHIYLLSSKRGCYSIAICGLRVRVESYFSATKL